MRPFLRFCKEKQRSNLCLALSTAQCKVWTQWGPIRSAQKIAGRSFHREVITYVTNLFRQFKSEKSETHKTLDASQSKYKGRVKIYSCITRLDVYSNKVIYHPTISIVIFLNSLEQKRSWQDARRDTWCVTSTVEYFDWFNKKLSIGFLLMELTIIYSKASFRAVALVYPNMHCTISLYLCTRLFGSY